MSPWGINIYLKVQLKSHLVIIFVVANNVNMSKCIVNSFFIIKREKKDLWRIIRNAPFCLRWLGESWCLCLIDSSWQASSVLVLQHSEGETK